VGYLNIYTQIRKLKGRDVKRERKIEMKHSLEELLIIPTFEDLQGFVVNKKFIVKEIAC